MKIIAPLLIVATLCVSPALAQSQTAEAFVCNYSGNAAPTVRCTDRASGSNRHAEKVVDRILRPIGLMRNFKIMECPETRNCFAAVMNGQRFILYDGVFMQQLEDETETDWSAVSIMAHEIGHHLQGHTLNSGGSSHQKELEADRFSGFVLHQLGATLNEATVAIRTIGSYSASSSHPGRTSRLDAITKGWTEADAIYPRTKSVVPSRPAAPVVASAPKPTAEPVTASTGVTPTLATQTYPGGKLKYKGGVLMGLRTGYGVYYYPNGDRYAGQFAYDQPHGKGTYYFSDGDRFVGTFRNGKRSGPGTLYDAEGGVEEEGNYANDVLR
ncbi:M48 family metalloprotease [Fibrella sp. WM1]|uniref:M48 family metalloprotease n=1 Tax=Fibrella musci TaxID=3242485 RepID=UPI0035200453